MHTNCHPSRIPTETINGDETTKKEKYEIADNGKYPDKDKISTAELQEALSTIQAFILYENAFPSNEERYNKAVAVIQKLTQDLDKRNLIARVSIWVYPVYIWQI